MIKQARGNLLQADTEALVNTVNCVGVMGKGVALQFKLAFPENFRIYNRACRKGDVQLGRVLVVPIEHDHNPRYIINFPTKHHWKGKSHIEDIRSGLSSLVEEVRRLDIRSIAIPALGCGNGGLNWSEVRPLIESAFTDMPGVEVLLFEPQGAPDAKTMPVATKPPRMTHGRAAILALLGHYQAISNELTMVAVQKLVYFLQEAGESFKLQFEKRQYGPYSETLHHVLQAMEGHYIRGYGDRSRKSSLTVVGGIGSMAQQCLETTPDTVERLRRVYTLIEGFESGYGMELLATVHWVTRKNMWAATDVEEAIKEVQGWSKRKSQRYKPEHIRQAWQRLHSEGWLLAIN